MNLTSFRQELQTAKVALDTDRTSTEESSSRASVSTGKARISRKDSQSVSELLYAVLEICENFRDEFLMKVGRVEV